MKFRNKPVSFEAHQWFKNGDHPNDQTKDMLNDYGHRFKSEGRVVRYHRIPTMDGMMACEKCGKTMYSHGWLDSFTHKRVVCPGDWIVTHPNGIYTSISEADMTEKYERVYE